MDDVLKPELIANGRDSGGDQSTKHLVEYYSRLGIWCDAAFEEAAGAQQEQPEIKGIATALDYLMGLQWKEAMPSYRAKPVSNEVLTMFWETIGLLTDVKPFFNVSDISGDGKYSEIQNVLNRLAKGWAATAKFERALSFATMFAAMTTCPAKTYWNPFAKGYSGDPSDGDISTEALSPTSLLRLGDGGYDIQDDECVIYRRRRTLEWIRRAYPRMGKHVKGEESSSKYTSNIQAPITVMPQMFSTLSPAAKRLIGGSQKVSTDSVYPMAEVREFWKKDDDVNISGREVWMGPRDAPWGYWVKPGQMLYPRGRLIVRANGITLSDEPNPYYHRKFPFSLLGLYSVPWQEQAMSLIAPWMSQQDILNQIMGGVVQCIKKAVSPALMAAKSAISPEAMRAIDSSKPNMKITYSAMAGTAPQWQAPPNVPSYVFQAYGIVQKSMMQTSGASAVGDALGKKQVPGGDTLDKIAFSKNTPIRMMGRNIEGFVDDIGTLWIGCALQFYDAAHRMELLGESGLVKEDTDDRPGSLIPDGINSETFVRRYRLKCDKGTLLNVQRQDKIQVSFALRKGRDLSRRKLFEVLDWNINQKENDAELAEEAKAMAAAAPPKGHK